MPKGKKIDTVVPIYRHESDRAGADCGRACAQMVISAFHLGRRNPPTPNHMVTPVTQAHLMSMESYPTDPGPGGWHTFPDELVTVLNSSEQLRALGLDRWRVAEHPATDAGLDALMEEIAGPLERDGVPAILNIKDPDHWVVVPTVWLGAKGQVRSLQYVDPAGWSHDPESSHTYVDDCQEEADADYWNTKTPTGLAQIDLEIENVPPLDYQGKYVAIVHGPGQQFRRRESSGVSERDTPVDLSLAPSQLVADSLRGLAADLDLTDLETLLRLGPRVRVWLVKDIGKSDQQYALASVSHPHSRHGAICVCNAATKEVGHLTISRRSETWKSLEEVPESETLWWSGERSAVWQPQFPFRFEAGTTQPRYRRLIDGLYF
jgi:hypothetical protein